MPDPWTAHEYRTMLVVQRAMVRAGWHPAVAGRLVVRAALRSRPASGLGRAARTRSVSVRPTILGEQCVRIAEVPGQEEQFLKQVRDFEQRGYNLMETRPSAGFPSGRVMWACPPGQLPREAEVEVLQAEPYGAPLYVKERF